MCPGVAENPNPYNKNENDPNFNTIELLCGLKLSEVPQLVGLWGHLVALADTAPDVTLLTRRPHSAGTATLRHRRTTQLGLVIDSTSRAWSNCSSVSLPSFRWPRSITTSRIVLRSFRDCLAIAAASS